jgi:mono/diheme cytochrome c family protein
LPNRKSKNKTARSVGANQSAPRKGAAKPTASRWSVGRYGLIAGGLIVATAGALAFVALQRLPVSRSDADDAAQVAVGRTVYASACASCHGAELEGQPDWRSPLPSGGFPAPPHDETGHTWHHSDAQLFDTTKQGGQALAPKDFKSNMPPFGDALSDQEIWAVLAYIKSRWPDQIQRRQAEINRRAGG